MKSISDKVKIITPGFPYKPSVGCFGHATTTLVFDNNKTILFDVGAYSLRQPLISVLLSHKVDIVVISHLHFDHCSNLDLFIGKPTEIIISKKEMDYYETDNNKDCDLFSYFKYIKSSLNLKIIDEEMKVSDNCKILFTPGHTAGHISLEVKEKDGTVLLCGDCIKTRKELKKFSKNSNTVDKEKAIETRKKIKQKKYKYILFGHEMISGKQCYNIKNKIRRF